MAGTVDTSGSGEPDMALVGELFEEISRHPPAIGAMKLLVEHYIAVGWLDAAMDNAKVLNRLAPADSEVIEFLHILEKKPEPPTPIPTSATKSATSVRAASEPVKRNSVQRNVNQPENLDSARQDLAKNYTSLRERARVLVGDMLHLQALQKKQGTDQPQPKNMSRLQAFAEGPIANTTVRAGPPASSRSVSRIIQATPEKATELATVDLEAIMRWVREPYGQPSDVDDDTIRDALVKRMRAVEKALPEHLKIHSELALMHVEHENLDRNYNNSETMLGDMVQDIPRENFYVTEDNYAWDMEELAQAITVNGGVMRNPLSKVMFTPKDIKGIITHQHGKALGALQIEQYQMSKGVRPDTIVKMEGLARILLEDQSADSLPSRHAVDEFSAYCATLPANEQKVLNGLRCPAKDNHTGQSYDFTIGEAVRDAMGNRVCFHKTGDFITQAAAHLRRSQDTPPGPDKCVVM